MSGTMESTAPIRPLTFRVENIPPGTTAEQLKKYFYTEDQPRVQVRSIVPAVDSYEQDIQEYTATVTFQAPNRMVPSPRVIDDNLSIDSDFHGFTPLNQPQDPIAADIIAVTGLSAHAFGSWAHSSQNIWLRDYLPRDINNARVLIYGYHSQLHGNISRSILSDHSTNLIHRHLTIRDSAKALCDINGSVGIYSSRLPVRSIIFLGAPHKGLKTAALETLVKPQPTEDIIRELKTESPTLTELNDKFRHVAKDIDILTCYELSPTKTAVQLPDGTWKREGPPEMIVSLDSARKWYPREKLVACNADHSQIARLKRGENSIYPSVRWAIKQALLTAADLYSEAVYAVHVPPEPVVAHPSFVQSYNQSSVPLEACPICPAGGPARSQSEDVPPEPVVAHPSFVQSYNQSSVPLEACPICPAGGPTRSQSEDAIGQEIRRLQAMKISQDPNSAQNPSLIPNRLDETVSQWQRGLDYYKGLVRSRSSPSISGETDMTSSVFDRNESSSESPESTTSIGTEKSPISAQMDLRAQQQNSTVLQKKPISGKSQTSDVDHEFLAGSKSAQEPGQSVQIPREPAKREKPIFEQDDRPSSSALPPPPLERSQSNPEETSADPNRYVAADENATVGRFSTPGLPTRSVTGSNPTNALIALSEKNSPNEMAGSIQTPGPVPSSTRKEPPTDVGPKVKNTAYDYVLKAAIRAGNEDRTRELLAENYDVNCEGDYGITPLHTAARYRQEHIVRLLLENGAHPSVKCNKGNTSLHELAFYSGTPLPESLIDLFLQNIPLSDVPNTKGETPLMVAAAFGQEKLATKLIQRGANILAFDVIGRTPLHYAARTGKPDIITLLLKEGALLDQKTTDEDEFTPLQVAAKYALNSPETIERLVQAGADKEVKAGFVRHTPLSVAVQFGNEACVSYLLKSGANVEGPTRGGFTPLHFAAFYGRLSIVKMLLDNGANPLAKTPSLLKLGTTPRKTHPLENVPIAQHDQIVRLLKDAEKDWKKSGKR